MLGVGKNNNILMIIIHYNINVQNPLITMQPFFIAITLTSWLGLCKINFFFQDIDQLAAD